MKIISITQKACAPTHASLWCETKKDTIMKFNFTNKGKDTTVNYMGTKAYKMTPEMELYSTVVTCVVDDS